MSVYIYVQKANEEPITEDDLKAAVSKAPHYSIADNGMVQVPCLSGKWIWLEPTEGGLLLYQLLTMDPAEGEQIVDAIRRFAGCIPGAVVDAEGEILEPLPWDEQPGTAR
jgi:hypothetical protein